ncbi:maleylpyruvate isomerase family mycothiol-dependent enzyme [Planobispora siamensis]|uniref:Mycothiol-dependent maleylpyruvate isomerase metal-binding domain-containing protein n=1 Tax=Planobispora siamensis TaxID=936338 RepID=A0A8J3SKR0_9ACTN|nr:maleylpyruvate isomerase family mycothiol-dependent enzyme [Planobispora siamensis]GIH96203.1 hypothetical protein Psi01_68330 [Planobispora siamensis]
MELTPTQTIDGLIAEYEDFADLVGGLSPQELDTPTRCAGWAVRDVAGHVTGGALDTVALTIGARSPDQQAADLRDHDHAAELRKAAAELRALLEAAVSAWDRPSMAPDRTIGNGVLTLWYDTYMHADDVRSALGRPSERGPGLAASVRWMLEELGRKGWGPARVSLTGLRERGAGEAEIGGGGPLVRADALRFMLAATGRIDPAEVGLDESVNIYR